MRKLNMLALSARLSRCFRINDAVARYCQRAISQEVCRPVEASTWHFCGVLLNPWL